MIVGPTSDAPHGRLTVNAGPGDDVISPGRGGSLVELGTGADKVIFDHGDLFGIANFLDFRISDGDTLVVSDGIDVTWNLKTPDTLILSSAAGTKTLRLTPIGTSGDLQWNPELVQTISTSAGINLGELNYIETHSFIDPANTDLTGYTLRVGRNIMAQSQSGQGRNSMNYDSYRVGDSMTVFVGNTEKTYSFKRYVDPSVSDDYTLNFDIPLSDFPQMARSNATMSMTPLIQPTNTNATFYEGTVKTTISSQDLKMPFTVTKAPSTSIYLALLTTGM